MECIVKGFDDQKNFVVISAFIEESEAESKQEANSLVTAILPPEILKTEEGQRHKLALTQMFKQMGAQQNEKELDLFEIPMDKQQFEESKIKLGSKIFVEVKLTKNNESKKIN